MGALPAASAGAIGGVSVATLWLVFLTGLVGGFGHCIGMCGPIVAAFGFGDGSIVRQGADSSAAASHGASLRPVGLFQVGYQVGRMTTYTLIGGLLGALGGAGVLAELPGATLLNVQQWLGVAAGTLMVLMGLALVGLPGLSSLGRWIESGAGAPGSRWFARVIRRLAGGGTAAAIPLGMAMGLVPCGFLMTIEVQALASGSAAAGAVTMLVFAIGTVPALAVFGLASGVLGLRARGWLGRAGAVLVILLGLLTIGRALGVATLTAALPVALHG
jgi:hypothetical protein